MDYIEGLQELTNALSNGNIPDPMRPPVVWAQPETAPILGTPINSGTSKATDF